MMINYVHSFSEKVNYSLKINFNKLITELFRQNKKLIYVCYSNGNLTAAHSGSNVIATTATPEQLGSTSSPRRQFVCGRLYVTCPQCCSGPRGNNG